MFQALDLVFIGVLNKSKGSVKGDFGDESDKDQIAKLIQTYGQPATHQGVHSY
jgi:hypothetical protein